MQSIQNKVEWNEETAVQCRRRSIFKKDAPAIGIWKAWTFTPTSRVWLMEPGRKKKKKEGNQVLKMWIPRAGKEQRVWPCVGFCRLTAWSQSQTQINQEEEEGVVGKRNPIWIDPRVVWYLHSSGGKRLQLAGFSAAFRRRAREASDSLPEWENTRHNFWPPLKFTRWNEMKRRKILLANYNYRLTTVFFEVG